MRRSTELGRKQSIQGNGKRGSVAVLQNRRGSAVLSPRRPSQARMSSSTLDTRSRRNSFNMIPEEESEADRNIRVLSICPALEAIVKEHAAEIAQVLVPQKYRDGEYIITQGHHDNVFYIIEEGSVMLTVNKTKTSSKHAEDQVGKRGVGDLLGEVAFLRKAPRSCNARAIGVVKCMKLSPDTFGTIFQPLYSLLLYRHQLREHSVMDKLPVFGPLDAPQKSKLIDRTEVFKFNRGDYLCKQGHDGELFYIVIEGRALVSVRTNGKLMEVAKKYRYDGVGEVCLLGSHEHTADVVAMEHMICLGIYRKHFMEMVGGDSNSTMQISVNSFQKEWDAMQCMTAMGIQSVGVMQKVCAMGSALRRASTTTAFSPSSAYFKFFQRMKEFPELLEPFATIAATINWSSMPSALNSIYLTSKAIASKEISTRSDVENYFLGRLTEKLSFIQMFNFGDNAETYHVACQLSTIMQYSRVRNGKPVFNQGVVEGRAYIIISGSVNIVCEDVHNGIHHNETLATLRSGSSFGELSLVASMQRTASAIAGSDTDLFYVDKAQFQTFVKARPCVSVKNVMLDRAYFLASLPHFKDCGLKICIRYAHFMEAITYPYRHIICQQGESLSHISIIVSGEIALLKRHTTDDGKQAYAKLAALSIGESFGISVLFPKLTEETTYFATSEVHILRISLDNWTHISPNVAQTISQSLQCRRQFEIDLGNHLTHCKTFFDIDKPWLNASNIGHATTLHRRVTARNQSTTRPPSAIDTNAEKSIEKLWTKLTTPHPSTPPIKTLSTKTTPPIIIQSMPLQHHSPFYGSFLLPTSKPTHLPKESLPDLSPANSNLASEALKLDEVLKLNEVQDETRVIEATVNKEAKVLNEISVKKVGDERKNKEQSELKRNELFIQTTTHMWKRV